MFRVLQLEPRTGKRIAEKRTALDLQRPLSPDVVRQLHADMRVNLAYHSNAIEGNTLNLSETQMIIEHGVTIGGHTMTEHVEALNSAAAFDALHALVAPTASITEADVCGLHRLVTDRILQQPGTYRTGAVSIRGSQHQPPPARDVPVHMTGWVNWLSDESHTLDPFVRATIAHHAFLAIHPFLDGNGRTARLLLALMLMRDGYPPPLILVGWRASYIRALQAADAGNYALLLNLIGRAVEHSLDTYLDAIRDVPDQEYQPAPDIAIATGMDGAYLGLLLRKGQIAGKKHGGRWYTTAAAVERYRSDVAQRTVPRGRRRTKPRET